MTVGLLSITPKNPFRIKVYGASLMRVKTYTEDFSQLGLAMRHAKGKKIGSKFPDTLTFRISQVDVEEWITGHWTLHTRINHEGTKAV